MTSSEGRSFIHFLCAWPAAVFLAAATAQRVPAATNPSREQPARAAAILNVIAFTEWPAGAFAADDSPLVIGVLGQEPLVALLDDFLGNEIWHGRKIALRRLTSVAEARSCHVVYIAQSEHARWPAIAGQFATLAILTVSYAENFAQHGGTVQLEMERNAVRPIVNLDVARRSGVTISSKLLRLARVIGDRNP
ncbi:MAG: YfiR family protein [Opitutaceae bacterium]